MRRRWGTRGDAGQQAVAEAALVLLVGSGVVLAAAELGQRVAGALEAVSLALR